MKGDNPLNRMASFCNAFFRLKSFNDLHAWITMAHWTEVWNTCKSTSKFFLSISLLWHFQSTKVWFSEGLTIKTALKFTRALKYLYMLTEHASLYAQSQRIEFDFQSEWLKKVSLKFNFTKSLKYWYMLNEHVCSGYEKSFTLDL